MAANMLYLQYHKHPTVIGSEIHSYFRSEAFTDLIIFCDGGHLRAHQLVLASVSPFLKSIFNEIPNDPATMFLPEVPLDDMTALVHFLYGGEVIVPLRQLGSLQDLTKFLHMDKNVQNFRVEIPDPSSEHVRVRLSDSSLSESEEVEYSEKFSDRQLNEDTVDDEVPSDDRELEYKVEPPDEQGPSEFNSGSTYSENSVSIDQFQGEFSQDDNGEIKHEANSDENQLDEIYIEQAVDMSQPSRRKERESQNGALNCSLPKKNGNNNKIFPAGVRGTRGLRGGTLKRYLTNPEFYMSNVNEIPMRNIKETRNTATPKQAAPPFRVPVTMIPTNGGVGFQLKCSLCKYDCTSYEEFKKHEKLHRPAFTCEFCGKGFFIKWNLVAHLRTHTGEKPFLCNFCQQPFRQKAHLIKHISAVHGHKEEKSVSNLGPVASFLCSFCNVAFEDKEQVRKHISQEHRDLLKRAY